MSFYTIATIALGALMIVSALILFVSQFQIGRLRKEFRFLESMDSSTHSFDSSEMLQKRFGIDPEAAENLFNEFRWLLGAPLEFHLEDRKRRSKLFELLTNPNEPRSDS